jgi:two-component system sensor histidine kinase ChvG
VFENLISNALSFSTDKKPITVTIESNTQRAKIMVDDEGPGIPESRLEKIFDRFYSERPVSESFGMHSGLGLSIARQIVESHGGSIYAENRKDADGKVLGARFIVKLRVPTE